MCFNSLYDESNTKKQVNKPKKPTIQLAAPTTRRTLLKLENNQTQSGVGKANKSAEVNPESATVESAKNSTTTTNSISKTNQYNGNQQQPKQRDQVEAYNLAQLSDESFKAKKQLDGDNEVINFDNELLKEILIEIQENNENKQTSFQSNCAAFNNQSAAYYSSENSKLNEIIDELIDFTNNIPSPNEPAQMASMGMSAFDDGQFNKAELLKREQSQINSYMSQMNDLSEVENFDFELFDNILISNNDPMLANIKLL